jgi:hypothetical protein
VKIEIKLDGSQENVVLERTNQITLGLAARLKLTRLKIHNGLRYVQPIRAILADY